MKGIFGPADPKNKKGAEAIAKNRAQLERMKSRLNQPTAPMPEWAIEEAIIEGRRQKAKGFKSPLACQWEQWPLARRAYVGCWN